MMPLGQIPNKKGFRFIGIDNSGGEHYCIVRRGGGNLFYMSSNTVLFSDLVGWIDDTSNNNEG